MRCCSGRATSTPPSESARPAGAIGGVAPPFRHFARRRDFAGLAAAELEDEPGRDIDAPIDRDRVDAALEPIAGIGEDTELAAIARDVRGVEIGDFEEDVD